MTATLTTQSTHRTHCIVGFCSSSLAQTAHHPGPASLHCHARVGDYGQADHPRRETGPCAASWGLPEVSPSRSFRPVRSSLVSLSGQTPIVASRRHKETFGLGVVDLVPELVHVLRCFDRNRNHTHTISTGTETETASTPSSTRRSTAATHAPTRSTCTDNPSFHLQRVLGQVATRPASSSGLREV